MPPPTMPARRVRGGVAISASQRIGLDQLLQKAERTLFAEEGNTALTEALNAS